MNSFTLLELLSFLSLSILPYKPWACESVTISGVGIKKSTSGISKKELWMQLLWDTWSSAESETMIWIYGEMVWLPIHYHYCFEQAKLN